MSGKGSREVRSNGRELFGQYDTLPHPAVVILHWCIVI